MQDHGGPILKWAWWIIAGPFLMLLVVVLADISSSRVENQSFRERMNLVLTLVFGVLALGMLYFVGSFLGEFALFSSTGRRTASAPIARDS